jgi:hypothetical protein
MRHSSGKKTEEGKWLSSWKRKNHFSSSFSSLAVSKNKEKALIYVTRWCGGGGLVASRAVEGVVVVAVVVENDRW